VGKEVEERGMKRKGMRGHWKESENKRKERMKREEKEWASARPNV
jgi:hypothetical protein